jgi:hypothetical protein
MKGASPESCFYGRKSFKGLAQNFCNNIKGLKLDEAGIPKNITLLNTQNLT